MAVPVYTRVFQSLFSKFQGVIPQSTHRPIQIRPLDPAMPMDDSRCVAGLKLGSAPLEYPEHVAGRGDGADGAAR